MTGQDARRRAWETLRAVEGGASLDPALGRAFAGLRDPRDRAFCAELVQGVLRWRGRYDFLIDRFAKHPGRVGPDVRMVLRLALHQLLACDGVPDYAALDQSVRLARQAAGAGKAGFVNGLLQAVRRKLGETPAVRSVALPAQFPSLVADPVAHLATWGSLPRWLAERWVSRFGPEGAAAVCAATNDPPPLWFHVVPGADPGAAAAELAAAGHPCDPAEYPRALRLRDRMSRDALSTLLAERPHLIVQDLHVQEATDFLADGVEGPVLDLCAAPGGKTLHLRRRLPATELLVAADLGPSRLESLCHNLERVEPGPVSVVSADGRRAPFVDGSFGAVLLDGPCSGTGVLRHHPEGRWRLEAGTPVRNGVLLGELAAAAARLLRPGGRLLYATCSLEPEENEDVLATLSAAVPELTPDPGATGTAVRNWWPTLGGGDGFFAARLRKTGHGAATSPGRAVR